MSGCIVYGEQEVKSTWMDGSEWVIFTGDVSIHANPQHGKFKQ